MAIDLLSAFRLPPPELDFVWPGFLAGTVGALVAPGATGKSFWALEAAMSIACSVAGGDGFYPVSTDGFKRAANFLSCLATLRRILGL